MSMNRKVIAFCVISATAAFLLGSGRPGRTNQPKVSIEQGSRIPDHKIYEFMFSKAAFFRKKADELARQGRDAREAYGFFHRQAQLTQEQGRIFDAVQADCEREVAELDARARSIISAFRSQYPGGVVPRGQTLPPPPAELKSMQAQRDAAFVRARDRLRAAFGEREFGRFDKGVKERVVPFGQIR